MINWAALTPNPCNSGIMCDVFPLKKMHPLHSRVCIMRHLSDTFEGYFTSVPFDWFQIFNMILGKFLKINLFSFIIWISTSTLYHYKLILIFQNWPRVTNLVTLDKHIDVVLIMCFWVNYCTTTIVFSWIFSKRNK